MTNEKTVADKYREAIESMDTSVDTDIESQRHTRRELKLSFWDEEQAKTLAEEQGIKLSEAHLDVVHKLRDHYQEKGLAETGRELEEMLANEFSSQGGSKYLRKLFPDGPVTQGMRIAGLPVPPYSEHDGFGTAY